MSADLLLMLLADARLPVAGHTQSAGLEPAVLGGLREGQVPAYLHARLGTVTTVEAATAVVALHHLRQGLPLDPVVAAWAARTPSPALRRVSRTQGHALHRLLLRLWPAHCAVAAVAGPAGRGAPRSVVLA
ncbi:MAG: urease accessory UreF family protein, partial [Nocardioides sp.]|uniref:urease accessory UreF family protein n=1 Tax=Nocardioides sp. TaxID=35761 RepID=UPI0039E65DF1